MSFDMDFDMEWEEFRKDEFHKDYEISFIEVEDFIISAGDNDYD